MKKIILALFSLAFILSSCSSCTIVIGEDDLIDSYGNQYQYSGRRNNKECFLEDMNYIIEKDIYNFSVKIPEYIYDEKTDKNYKVISLGGYGSISGPEVYFSLHIHIMYDEAFNEPLLIDVFYPQEVKMVSFTIGVTVFGLPEDTEFNFIKY